MIEKMTKHSTEQVIHVAPSPHVFNCGLTTRRMMADVLIALAPVVAVSIYTFHWFAVKQLAICIVACLAAETVFTRWRGRETSLTDLSAVVTGVILGLSLPATAPWYVGAIGAMVAIGIGKTVFGGLGMNLFNPAMVGRAFVMIAFSGALAASGYVEPLGGVDAMTRATPLTVWKQSGDTAVSLIRLFFGGENGSVGETSALACLIGGVYLCIRRTASWEIPVGMLAAMAVAGGFADIIQWGSPWTLLHHLTGGAAMFGAFFIATDPVSSPLAPRGKWVYGIGIGLLVMIIRWFSGYPEGVMFAVLLMNGATPLINRWSIPRPFGGVR